MIKKVADSITAKKILKEAYESNDMLEFICYFKGIPLTHKATIDKLTAHYILFNTFPTQIVAIKETGHVFIKYSKYNDNVIGAKFLQINKKNKESISLYDFDLYDKNKVGIRKKLRIVPDDTFSLKVIDRIVKIYSPQVVDISDDSIALDFNELPSTIDMKSIFYAKMIFKVSKGSLYTPITLKCKPLMISKIGNNFRVVANFIDVKEMKKTLLDKYLVNQQLRILKEFRTITNIELGKEQ